MTITCEQIQRRVLELGLTLPPPPAPVAAYVPWRLADDLVFISGQIPVREGSPIATGSVPSVVSEADAVECARLCALNGLAVLNHAMQESDRTLEHAIRVGCFIASDPGFGGQPKIANGVSDLLVDVLGEAGKHARAAVGSVSLPLNVPVEVEFLFKLSSGTEEA